MHEGVTCVQTKLVELGWKDVIEYEESKHLILQFWLVEGASCILLMLLAFWITWYVIHELQC